MNRLAGHAPRAVKCAPRAMAGWVMPGVRSTPGRWSSCDARGRNDPPPCAGYCTSHTSVRLNVVFAQLGSTARHRTARHRKHRNVLSNVAKPTVVFAQLGKHFEIEMFCRNVLLFQHSSTPQMFCRTKHFDKTFRLWADLYPPKCCKRNVLSSCANTTLGFATFQQNISFCRIVLSNCSFFEYHVGRNNSTKHFGEAAHVEMFCRAVLLSCANTTFSLKG